MFDNYQPRPHKLRSYDNETEDALESIDQELDSISLYGNFGFPNRKKSSEFVFGLMMRAHYGKQTGDKFQPCQDELDFLRSMPKAVVLCDYFRNHASLKEFSDLLYPNEGKDGLKRCDSIFHLHGDSIKNDKKEFKDLTKRAKRLAEEIKKEKTKVHLLDGHGRMLVCLLKELEYPDYSVDIRLFELSEVVHEYHNLVMPRSIEKVNRSIIDLHGIPPSGVIYLNFCSIPSMKSFDWTKHFEDQNYRYWVYGCCKENVLKYIWKVTTTQEQPCTVMISCVIKETPNEEPFPLFSAKLGNCITGLDFLRLLRREDLFDAEIVSIRPESDIIWEDDKAKRIPKKLRSGGHGCPFVTLLVKPLLKNPVILKRVFEELEVADLREEDIQRGARVIIKDGINKGMTGVITSRTAVFANVILHDRSTARPSINQL